MRDKISNYNKMKNKAENVGSSYFDISATYAKGHSVMFNDLTYIFEPNEEQEQFSTGILPNEGHGWRIA